MGLGLPFFLLSRSFDAVAINGHIPLVWRDLAHFGINRGSVRYGLSSSRDGKAECSKEWGEKTKNFLERSQAGIPFRNSSWVMDFAIFRSLIGATHRGVEKSHPFWVSDEAAETDFAQSFEAEEMFSATASRISVLSAFWLSFSPWRKSMARRTLPSRLELKRPAGSGSAAPLAKVIFTTLL